MLREGNSTDVDLAEAEPRKDDGKCDDALEPESGVVLAGMWEGLARLAIVVGKENNLGPDKS